MDYSSEMDDVEVCPSIETVYQAITTLNSDNSNNDALQDASSLLTGLQKSNFAWKVSEELLSRKIDHYSCFFAAQTIQAKLQHESNGIPLESLNSVHNYIYDYLSKLDDTTDRVIATQLCVALSRVIIGLGNWRTASADIVGRYKTMSTLFINELLTVLVDEVHTRAMHLANVRCMQLYTEFALNVPVIIEYLDVCLKDEPNDERLKSSVYKCFGSWVSIDCVCSSAVWRSCVLTDIFSVLSTNNCSPAVHGVAADAVISFFTTLNHNIHDKEALHSEIFGSVKRFEQAYMVCVTNDDTERSKNYSRIFSDLAEMLLSRTIDKILRADYEPHFAIKTLESCILCLNNDNYEVAQVTFSVWSRLADLLGSKEDSNLNEIYKAYFDQLPAAVYKLCVIDIFKVNLVDENDKDVAEIRRSCAGLIKDIIVVVSPSSIFQEMYVQLQTGTMSNEAWNQKEAALFIMQAAASDIDPDENDVVPKVIEAILNMPDSVHVNIRYTSVLLLGELGNWISHGPHSKYLEPILNYLRYCVQQDNLASVIAKALHNICITCRLPMANFISGLIEMLGVIDNFNLSNDDAIGLLKGVTVVIAEIPEELVYEAIKEVCWRQFKPLLTLMETNAENTVTNTPSDPIYWLERLLAIFRNLTVKRHSEHDPAVIAVVEMWPYMSNICDRYKTDPQVTEYICRCLRYMIGLVSHSTVALLSPVAQQMTFLYREHHHNCYLYIGLNLVDEYASAFENPLLIAECHSILLTMIESFIEPAFHKIDEEGGLSNHPEIVVGFFRLASRFVEKLTKAFLQSPVLVSVIRCSLLALSFNHKEANEAVVRFLVDLLGPGNPTRKPSLDKTSQAHILSVLTSFGEQLLDALLLMAVSTPHSTIVPDVMDVILEFEDYDKARTLEWLNNVILSLPETNSAGRPTADTEQRMRFLNCFHSNEHQIFLCHSLREFREYFQ